MKRKKTPVRKGNFLKKVQNSLAVKRVRAKIRENEKKRKGLSRLYKTTIKKVSKRLAK